MGKSGSSSAGAEFATSSAQIVDPDGDENVERGNWSGKLDFILSCLGYAVGLGNVWRFPYLAYSQGGAIFLIPYALSLFLIGVPIFFLELSLGQFTSSGPLTCWQFAPIFQGVGAAMLVVSCILAIYYNIIIAWSIYYLVASFTVIPSVPWQHCDTTWATPFCADYVAKINSSMSCSSYNGYNGHNSSGKYIPFDNGLCIGLREQDVNADWFVGGDAERDIPGAFFYKHQYNIKVFKEEFAGNNSPINTTWLEKIRYQPYEDSNFTLGLVGFWNQTRASDNGYKREGASAEYFMRKVLRRHESTGMKDMGKLHWDLALCLLAAWLIVFLCLIKGIKSSGKVVYFTAIFPYVVLFILMIRGAMMEGSMEGVLYYIRGYGTHPDDIPADVGAFYREKLSNIDVWKKAAEQIFFSLSACYGGLIALASYNRFGTNAFRDTMIVTFGNCFTSFFAGFVIFSFLGALATELGVKVSEVAGSGIGLAFIVYPEAVTHIPPAPLWAILFFLMLLTLGLDSEFALMETLLTSTIDVFPKIRPYKTPCIAVLCGLFFLCGLSMCTSGGLLMLNLLDSFGAGWNVFVIAVLECVAVAWVYCIIPGLTNRQSMVTRFVDDIQTMLGSDYVCFVVPWKYFRWFWMFMWAIVTPILCLILMIFALDDYVKKDVKLSDGDYVYEEGFVVLGWMITVLVIAVLAAGAILAIMKHGLKGSLHPSRYWGPALSQHRRLCEHHEDMEYDPWNKGLEMQDNSGYMDSKDTIANEYRS